MACIAQHEAEDLANAREGWHQGEGMGLRVRGGFEARACEVLAQCIIRGEQVQSALHSFVPGRRLKARGDPWAVGGVGAFLAERG
jgi:hypothetical protein